MDDEEPVRVRDEDEDVESAVRSVIAQCLQLVAMRDFVDNNRHLIDDLEELQRRTWAHDEWKHSQQQKKALSGGRHAAALQQAGSGNAKSQPRKGTQKDSAPHRSGKEGTQKDREAALAKEGYCAAEAALYARGSKAAAAGGSSAGGASSSSASGSMLDGAARRSKCKGATPATVKGVAVAPSPFGSYAESLLPAAPAVRSQFVFEVEKAVNMHAPHDEQRQLQRRLSMLSTLQQETIKAERKARLDKAAANGTPNLFFKANFGERPIGAGVGMAAAERAALAMAPVVPTGD